MYCRKRLHRCTAIILIACTVIYLCLFNIFAIYNLARSSQYSPSWIQKRGHLYVAHLTFSNFTCKPLKYSKVALPVTALVSFPGSGNTWVRHIIQESTGFLTGSVYYDVGLKRGGFPGEGVTNSSVIAIKTHAYGWTERRKYARAVIIIRDPYQAILAEFNRRYGGHRGYAIKAHFDREWYSYVFKMADDWYRFYSDWLKFSGPIHLIVFKNLKTNLKSEVHSLLQFMNFSITHKEFLCVMKNSEGHFRRPYMGMTKKKLFNSYMQHTIDSYKQTLSEQLSVVMNSEIKIS